MKTQLTTAFKSSLGFTILETLVAVAIASIAMAGVVAMIEQISSGTAEQKFVYESHDFTEELRTILGNGTACQKTFSSLNLATVPSGSTSHSIFSGPIMYDTGSAAYTPGDTPYHALKIRDMWLNNILPSPPSGGIFDVGVDYDAVTKVQGTSSILGMIRISYMTDGTGKVVNCVAMARATDGLWKITPKTNQDIYYSGGNVGIGVPAAAYPLQVAQLSGATQTDVGNFSANGGFVSFGLNNTSGSSQRSALLFESKGTAVFETGVDATQNKSQTFYIKDDVASAIRMLIDGNGNMGLGTSAPAARLHLADGINAGLFLQNTGDGSTSKFYNSAGTFLETQNTVAINSSNNQSLILNAGGGSVGIGTKKLVSKVTMYDPAGNLGTLVIPDNPGTWLSLWTGNAPKFSINYEKVQNSYRATVFRNQSIVNNGSDKWYQVFQGAGSGSQYDQVRFFGGTQETGYEKLIIDSGSLVVAGGSGVKGNITVSNGNIYVNGNVAATGTVTAQSDERLKKDIKVIPNALEGILGLRGVTYVWKDPKREAGPQIGLIAQDVEKHFPAAVKTDEKGIKSVNYNGLMGPVVEAVKEIWSYVTGLKARLDAQQKEIEDLRRAIAELRRDLAKKH